MFEYILIKQKPNIYLNKNMNFCHLIFGNTICVYPCTYTHMISQYSTLWFILFLTETREPKNQRTRELENQIIENQSWNPRELENQIIENKKTRELYNQRTNKLENQRTREPENQKTREPKNKTTRELENQRTREPENQGTRELDNHRNR